MEEEERFEEHVRGKLTVSRSGKFPKIETEVSVSLRLENKDKLVDIVLEKTRELLKGSLGRIEGEEQAEA